MRRLRPASRLLATGRFVGAGAAILIGVFLPVIGTVIGLGILWKIGARAKVLVVAALFMIFMAFLPLLAYFTYVNDPVLCVSEFDPVSGNLVDEESCTSDALSGSTDRSFAAMYVAALATGTTTLAAWIAMGATRARTHR